MLELNVWPREPQTREDRIILSATIELTGRPKRELWYEFPIETADYLTDSSDPFLVASILMAMRNKAKIIVHGRVSPSLVTNLVEFQKHWHSWRPRRYHVVDIQADELQESAVERKENLALSAFTCGVDSTYTMYKHKKEPSPEFNVQAGLFVHGFDIPLADHDSFERAATTARSVLTKLDSQLITMASNHKELNPDWNDTHGIAIGSCLMFFQKHYSSGLIPSTYRIERQVLPWGSNVITDKLMSSDSFRMVYDGADVGRKQKVLVLSTWSEGFDNLRVCFQCQERDKNCGRCGKCLMTALSIRSMDLPNPKSFPEITDKDILGSEILDEYEISGLEVIHKSCSNTEASWVLALDRCIRRNKLQNTLRKPERWMRKIVRAARSRLGSHKSSGY